MKHSSAPAAVDDPRVHELALAFAAFNQTSAQLEAAYRELEQRVAVLTDELAEARSERLRQLAEKERLAARLQRLLETLPGGVVVLDGAGRVQESNPGAKELLGEPLRGCDWDAVLARSLESGAASGTELHLRGGRHVSVSSRRLLAEPGRIILLTDVTETRRLHALLARNERLSAMGEMTARLAHQTRTPLAAAILYASQLAGAGVDPRVTQRFAEKLLARLHHLERMVNDMLCFARGTSAGLEDIEVTELFAAVLQIVQPQLGTRVTIHAAAVPADLTLRGNREALLGALLNLISNAAQIDAAAVRIELAAGRTTDGGTELWVHDDGPGIAATLRDKIFEPFFTTRSDGTGLGLAVVQSVARAHGGYARVTAGAHGGASFCIHLPNVERAALPSHSAVTDSGTKAAKPASET